QFRFAVRANGAARVNVRVDQRSETYGRLCHRVEVQAKFAGEVEVGPEPGSRDHLVDDQPATVLRDDGDAFASALQAIDAEAGDELDPALGYQGLDAHAQGAPLRQGVGSAAPEHLANAAAPYRPQDFGAVDLGGECREV